MFGLIAFGFLRWNLRSISSISLIPSSVFKNLIPIIGGIIFGILAQNNWHIVLLHMNKAGSGIVDPVFAKDVSFYLFSLPFYTFLISWFLGLFFITLIIVEAFYISNKLINAGVRHGTLLGTGILAVIIWKTILAQYSLLYSKRGAIFGASYADVHAQILAYKIFAVITIGVLLVLIFSKNLKIIWRSLGGWAAAWFVVVVIYPNFVQHFSVRPNELERERPFIKHNIEFTRLGYNIASVKEKAFSPQDIDNSILKRNYSTIRNIRLWDPRALLSTYKQLQEIRSYYEFTGVDIDRYWISGQYTQVMLAPRELNQGRLPEASRTWINQHFKYTHGYGLCLNPVNEITPEGFPNLLIKDTPPKSAIPKIQITRPEIYFGEQTNTHIFVKTLTEEFDYPKGDKNAYCTYEGEGGVSLLSFWRKFAYALRFDGIKLLLSKYITKESRILFRRHIIERVWTIAPFLHYDRDPYLVISDAGHLYWIWDAYTVSNKFPYSEKFTFKRDTLNYIRNSVKVLVDAYNGSVKFFVFDPDDPVIKTWANIFPVLFSPQTDFPKDLLKHIRYPEDYLSLQARVYSIYHMTDPDVFYNKEDVWHIASEIYIDRAQPMVPYFIIARLEEKPEFILMIPFTPAGKNNMIAWLAGRCDAEVYGTLLAYKFPKDKLIYGPMQVEARIDQDAEISAQLTLWGQRGSQVIRGNTLIIPLEQSLLYVEPLYLQATESRMPEFKKIIVASGDRLVWADSFQEALKELVSGYEVVGEKEVGPKAEKITPVSIADLVNRALKHLKNYKQLVGKGLYREAGSQLRQLEEALKRAVEKRGK